MHDGRLPNNAFFHAEATALVRAARANGGSLAGKTLDVEVSRAMCARAREIFPLLGLELGNPTVTFICPGNIRQTMRDGAWCASELPGVDLQVSGTAITRKRSYFASFPFPDWPRTEDLESFFLAPAGRRWFNAGGNDSASLIVEGRGGTLDLPRGERFDTHLYMWGNPQHGVLLLHMTMGGGFGGAFSSKGDLRRLGETVNTLHDDPMPIGLFIPFEAAWIAVREFIETGGGLSDSIAWVSNGDLPAGTFPDP
jgi:hypothetical protein